MRPIVVMTRRMLSKARRKMIIPEHQSCPKETLLVERTF